MSRPNDDRTETERRAGGLPLAVKDPLNVTGGDSGNGPGDAPPATPCRDAFQE